MATIENTNHSRIVKIDLDTAKYIIEKVIDAAVGTVNNMIYPDITNKDYIEMFKDFSNQLVNILNEIKKIKED